MKYSNPIIRGFNPDPSICRVGDDYYLVTSSFEYFPGIPVYHSRDLVNWEMVGHCIDREEQLPLEMAKSSGGIWAPTIRYSEGRFYVTATFAEKGNFLIYSDNPMTGWSDPVWIKFSGLDPSMFFENGKMYYCANDIGERYSRYGGEGISMVEMDPETGGLLGESRRIWQGAGGGWLEAPHIYHIGEYYYIIAAEGGTNQGHHVIAGRSRRLWGPYENCPDNPILTNRNDCTKQISCSGHGDLTDDKNGNWWMVHLGTRSFENMSQLGRETFLMPVTFKHDWPAVGEGRAEMEVYAPLWKKQRYAADWSANFSHPVMEKQWLFRRIPNKDNYRREGGQLCIKPARVKLQDAFGSPAFMAVRLPDRCFCAEAEMVFETVSDGDCAGMAVYLNEDYYYRICKKRENGREFAVFERQVGDMNCIVFKKAVSGGRLRLRVESDGEKYNFYYAETENYINAGSGTVKYLSPELAGKCFTGSIIGMFAESEEETDARLLVYRFGFCGTTIFSSLSGT